MDEHVEPGRDQLVSTTSVSRTFWNTPPVSSDGVEAAGTGAAPRPGDALARPIASWNPAATSSRRHALAHARSATRATSGEGSSTAASIGVEETSTVAS